MANLFNPANVTVLMPVGGRATRALEITGDDFPKHLITLGNGLPVLEITCRQLQIVGFRRFVFCTGHHQEQTEEFVRRERWIAYQDVSYEISVELEPLGPEGAVLAAIYNFNVAGQAMFIAGDVLVPWGGLVTMNERHALSQGAITAGLTSYVTPRTTDIGKFIVDPLTSRIIHVYGRTEEPVVAEAELALTSAGISVVTVGPYVDLCEIYKASRRPEEKRPFSLRDDVLPWALETGRRDIYGYDLCGEVLDLGTPKNIRYGRDNWSDYVLN